MKLINYICPKCNNETEILYTTEELKDLEDKIVYCQCKSKMKIFNFKNNSQVWKYNDTRG
jgi:hypothetical protein